MVEEAAERSPDTAFATFHTEPQLCQDVPLGKITIIEIHNKVKYSFSIILFQYDYGGVHSYQGYIPVLPG